MDEEKYVIFNPCDDYYDDYYRDDYDLWDKDYLEGLDIDYEWDPDDEYWDIDYEILEDFP